MFGSINIQVHTGTLALFTLSLWQPCVKPAEGSDPDDWLLIQPTLSFRVSGGRHYRWLIELRAVLEVFANGLWIFLGGFSSVSTKNPFLPQGIGAKQSVPGKSIFNCLAPVQPLTYSFFFPFLLFIPFLFYPFSLTFTPPPPSSIHIWTCYGPAARFLELLAQ